MSKSELIKLSGWAFIAGAFAFIALLSNSDPIALPGSIISAIFLAAGMLGLRARYGEHVGSFSKNMLLPKLWQTSTPYFVVYFSEGEDRMIADQVNTNGGFWLRVAAVLYAWSLSWPVHLPTLQYVIRERELPIRYVFGQPIHALAGPIMNIWGANVIIASILAFGILSAFEVLAGFWLWKRQRRGAMLALALLPMYGFFAWGWAVPYMFLIGALKVIALTLGRKSALTKV